MGLFLTRPVPNGNTARRLEETTVVNAKIRMYKSGQIKMYK